MVILGSFTLIIRYVVHLQHGHTGQLQTHHYVRGPSTTRSYWAASHSSLGTWTIYNTVILGSFTLIIRYVDHLQRGHTGQLHAHHKVRGPSTTRSYWAASISSLGTWTIYNTVILGSFTLLIRYVDHLQHGHTGQLHTHH